MIKYLFIKKFEWSNIQYKEDYQGHPLEGRVYKASYNENTKNHTLHGMGDVSVTIEYLKTSDPDRSYVSDILELTKETILSVDIQEEDLNKIINWNEMEDGESLELSNLPIPLQTLFTAMANQANQDEETIQAVASRLRELQPISPLQVEIAHDVVEHLTLMSMNEDAASELELDPDLGKGMNISHSIRAISRYISKDRRESDFEEDLYEAIGGLMRELERRRICDIG
jgi:hypothetical protein